MAVPNTASQSVTKTYRRQAMVWLLMTLIFGILTALVWMFSKTPAAANKIENAPITETATTPIDMTRPTKIDSLHELDGDVQPIDFDAMVRDLRQYPKEFKDKRYLIKHKGKWTVQVMNVAENDVIVDYLSGRKDREKFAYFRYRDDNDQLRFMLTYGVMNSAQEANGAAQLTDFGLPANVRVLPEQFNRYVNIIDNYELAEPVVDLRANRTRQVNLQPTRREVPVRKPKTETASDNKATSNPSDRSDERTVAPTPDKSIKQSEDPSETLAVKEERVVNVDGEKVVVTEPNRPTADKDNNAKSNKDSKETDKKPSDTEAAKKDKPTKNDKSDKNSGGKSNNASSGNKENDAIKELIEEKTN